MQTKLNIKKGDLVRVISGEARGKEGKVLSVDRTKMRASVEGLKITKRSTKPNAKQPNGGIVEKEGNIHISNLMVVVGGKVTRIGHSVDTKTGRTVRVAIKTKEVIK
jgi:large subunit ribosomal protein L24